MMQHLVLSQSIPCGHGLHSILVFELIDWVYITELASNQLCNHFGRNGKSLNVSFQGNLKERKHISHLCRCWQRCALK